MTDVTKALARTMELKEIDSFAVLSERFTGDADAAEPSSMEDVPEQIAADPHFQQAVAEQEEPVAEVEAETVADADANTEIDADKDETDEDQNETGI